MTTPAKGDRSLSFELKNDLTEIATLSETLERFCNRNGIGSDVSSVVGLALEEVVTNIISYGYTDGGDHRIWIDLAVVGTDLTARVQDDAAPFDPVQKEEPDLDVPLEERSVDGLGIHLVKTLMDAVTYSRESGRNVLLIRKSTVP
jgi:anti-sigma regulatory factor (Ser/Thr protein kinase)